MSPYPFIEWLKMMRESPPHRALMPAAMGRHPQAKPIFGSTTLRAYGCADAVPDTSIGDC